MTKTHTYLEIRHDAKGLLEIANQYTLAFDDKLFKKIVVILKGKRDPIAARQIPADEIIFLELSNLRGLNIHAIIKLLRICQKHRVTHIVTHRYKPTQLIGLVTLFFQPKLVLAVIHGNHQFDKFSRRIVSFLLFRKQYFKLIGVSETTRQDIMRWLRFKPPQDIIGVPNCIDIEALEKNLTYRLTARKTLKLDPESFVFGNIARLTPAKDQITLLRAFHSVHDKMSTAVLIIIGRGRLESTLKQETIRLGITDQVIFSGSIDHARHLMSAFDCFISTSITEGFGLVIAEAMAAKRPIIATRIGSFEEILGDTVPLVPCTNFEAIGQAMLKLYDSPEQQRRISGNQLYRRVCEKFSSRVFRDRIQHIYQSSV